MATTVNLNHDRKHVEPQIRTMILMVDNGPFKSDLLDFVRTMKTKHAIRILAGGTKIELAGRISNKLTEFEVNGDAVGWERAYNVWMDLKFTRFPNQKRDK
ncbi:hypothetical protein C8F04DRAFT_1188791 [Mycena alexandri]|uniref:Uncharacterized protein n=1 Tax=Mycena alexandri TaxID=1745969 RepID=A0AAD6WQ45_9AGAR|nr:hypothetical protein C8F04DRAFT_1197597 [Mycena alexandri]KAJ7028250.1 hypothetical protein C8F04DRAFT_1188791 [Mycena alexandri]